MALKHARGQRTEWLSLSAIAAAAVAATPGSATATIVSHQAPHLSFPIWLPGSNSVRLNYGITGTHFSTGDYKGKLIERRTNMFAYLTGVTAALGKKGQTFAQAGVPYKQAGIADKTSFVRSADDFVHTAPGHTGLKTAKSRVTHNIDFRILPYTHFIQKNSGYLFSSGIPVGFYESIVKTGSVARFGFGADQYALFRFDVDGQKDYGWLKYDALNEQHERPKILLLAYAYDTSGNPIPAGYTGIPEPSQLPLALGALSLGAIGLREWRKRRKHSDA